MRLLHSILALVLFGSLGAQSYVNRQVLDTLSGYQSATCLIIYDGAYTCTGTLLNNTAQNGKPLILSAAHCIDDPSQIESVVVVFGRQELILGSGISSYEWRSSFGAELLSLSHELDFALLSLNQELPDELMCQFLGWNTKPQTVPVSSIVHHPSFDFKEMAHSRNKATIGTFNGLTNTIVDGHWQVSEWTFGETVIGSSGAALLDDNLRVIGGLSGSTTRGDIVSDYFFRFDEAWDFSNENQLQDHLDPMNSNPDFLNSISFKELRNLQKVSSYHFSDSLGEYAVLDAEGLLIQDIPLISGGEISGVYVTVGQIGADLLNTITISVFSSGESIHLEEVSLFKLDENEENFIPFLSNISFQSDLRIEIRLNSTLEGEFVRFPTASRKNERNFLLSTLIHSARVEGTETSTEEPLLFPNPSKGYVFLNQKFASIEVYDHMGSYIKVPISYNAFGQSAIDFTNVASGTYILSILTENNGHLVEKVLIE